MKHITLNKPILVITLTLVIAYAVVPAYASAENAVADTGVNSLRMTDTGNKLGASLYALSGNSVATSIRIVGGKVVGCASLNIRNGYSWSTTLTLQKQQSDQSWSNMAYATSCNTELSLSRNASAGSYRINASVHIYDSDGKLIDSITRYSQVVQKKWLFTES